VKGAVVIGGLTMCDWKCVNVEVNNSGKSRKQHPLVLLYGHLFFFLFPAGRRVAMLCFSLLSERGQSIFQSRCSLSRTMCQCTLGLFPSATSRAIISTSCDWLESNMTHGLSVLNVVWCTVQSSSSVQFLTSAFK
jgi:hypothetical protein